MNKRTDATNSVEIWERCIREIKQSERIKRDSLADKDTVILNCDLYDVDRVAQAIEEKKRIKEDLARLDYAQTYYQDRLKQAS